jgi:hypothetical protein
MQFDAENRFLDDFKAKFLNEDMRDFSETAKIEDAAKYYE